MPGHQIGARVGTSGNSENHVMAAGVSPPTPAVRRALRPTGVIGFKQEYMPEPSPPLLEPPYGNVQDRVVQIDEQPTSAICVETLEIECNAKKKPAGGVRIHGLGNATRVQLKKAAPAESAAPKPTARTSIIPVRNLIGSKHDEKTPTPSVPPTCDVRARVEQIERQATSDVRAVKIEHNSPQKPTADVSMHRRDNANRVQSKGTTRKDERPVQRVLPITKSDVPKAAVRAVSSSTRNVNRLEQEYPGPSAPLLEAPIVPVQARVRGLDNATSRTSVTNRAVERSAQRALPSTHSTKGAGLSCIEDLDCAYRGCFETRRIWTITKYFTYYLAIISAVIQITYSFFLLWVGSAFVLSEKREANVVVRSNHNLLDIVVGVNTATEFAMKAEWPSSLRGCLVPILILYLICCVLLCYGLVVRNPWWGPLAMLPYCIGGIVAIIARLCFKRFPQNTLKKCGSGIFWSILVGYMVYIGTLVAIMVFLVKKRKRNRLSYYNYTIWDSCKSCIFSCF